MTTREVAQNGRKTVELGVPKGKLPEQEFLPNLRGQRAIKIYREMSDNDDTVGEILFAIEMLMRQVDWPVEPGGESPADTEAAEFLETCRDDLSHSWPDFIATVLTMLPFGWSGHEIVYKLRNGTDSRFDDGRIGWKKFSYQPQEALREFKQDRHGGIESFVWSAGGEQGEIPIDKLLLFRTTTARGPTGRSVLRNAYRPWWFKKHIEEFVAIAAERDANGVLKASIPAEAILERDEFFEEAKKVVTRYHRDEQAGFVWPLEYDEEGNELYKLEIMRSEVGSSIDAMRSLINQFGEAIAGVVLADFVRLGRTQSGSRALAEPKQQLFQKALQGWVTGIAEVLNRFAVPRLFDLNDFTLENLPRFAPEEIEDIQLGDLGRFIKDTAQAGMDWGFLDDQSIITAQVKQKAGFDG